MNTASTLPKQSLAGIGRFLGGLLRSDVSYFVIGLSILFLDWATGEFILFPVFFVLPVALASWFSNRSTAYALAILLPLGRLAIAITLQDLIPVPFAAVNAILNILVLGGIAYLARIACHTKQVERRAALMEGILPVCMCCKRIRDQRNNWSELEVYVTHHTDAAVSHGLCPECASTFYGDVFGRDRNA